MIHPAAAIPPATPDRSRSPGREIRSSAFIFHCLPTNLTKDNPMKLSTDETVIVPWDFSEMSEEALQTATTMVDSNAQLEVIHVTPYPAAVEPSVVWGTYSEKEIIANLEESFREQVKDKFADVNFTAMFGDPGSEISNFAKMKKAGLVVISSHGRRGLSRLFLGSVAERVVRLAPCPVLVLRDTDHEA